MQPAAAFHVPIAAPTRRRCRGSERSNRGSSSALRGELPGSGSSDGDEAPASTEAERLLAKARAIRESLGSTQPDESGAVAAARGGIDEVRMQSDFSLRAKSLDDSFRLYLDIGRESGTWMDPRWGASGRRIECTMDVSFGDSSESASDDITVGLIKTVTSKSSTLSEVCRMQYAPYARLRRGFDKMVIDDGGYCIESAPSSPSSTLRFCVSVGGATEGDVSIPEGKLYFALPYFGRVKGGDDGSTTMNLSSKEGTITVKQMGWHTGWYREESRILGVFRAVPLEKARERDKF